MSYDLNPFTGKFDKVSKIWKRDSTNGYLYPRTLTDKVGIGTDSPSQALDIDNSVDGVASDFDGIRVRSYRPNLNLIDRSAYGTGNGHNFQIKADLAQLQFNTTSIDDETFDVTNMFLDYEGKLAIASLTASLGVYTDASKKLTSTPPTSGILGYLSRTGTTLSTANAGDDLALTGRISLTKTYDATASGGTDGCISTSATLSPPAAGLGEFSSILGAAQLSGTNYLAGDVCNGLKFTGGTAVLSTTGTDKLELNAISLFGAEAFASSITAGEFNLMKLTPFSILGGSLNCDLFYCSHIINPKGSGNPDQVFQSYIENPLYGTDKSQFFLEGFGSTSGMKIGGLCGANVIANINDRDFQTGATNWSGTNWARVNVVFGNYGLKHTAGSTADAVLTSTYLKTGAIKSGKTYRVKFEIRNRNAGSVTPKIGTASGTACSADGFYQMDITANADDASLIFTPTSDFNGDIGTFKPIEFILLDNEDFVRVYSPEPKKLNIGIDDGGSETDIVEIDSDGMKITGSAKIGDGGTTDYTEVKADGEINLHGTARVIKCVTIRVGGFKAPGANPADFEALGIAGCYAFADNVQQYISTEITLPTDMDRSVAPYFIADWSAAATTGTAVWQLEYLYRAEDEDMTASAQATVRGEATPSGTANGLVRETLTGISAPSSTDRGVLVRVSRDTTDGTYTDDMAGDAHLTALKFCYTSNKLGEAT